jgi:hypothetical protein
MTEKRIECCFFKMPYWSITGREGEGDRYSEEKEREREAVAESITAFFFS